MRKKSILTQVIFSTFFSAFGALYAGWSYFFATGFAVMMFTTAGVMAVEATKGALILAIVCNYAIPIAGVIRRNQQYEADMRNRAKMNAKALAEALNK